MRISSERELERTKAVCQILLVCTLLFVVPTVAHADETDPQMQRFLLEERLLLLDAYLMAAKTKMDRSWKEWKKPANVKPLVTTVMATIDAKGNIASCELVKSSSSQDEDGSVQDSLRKTAMDPLPDGNQLLQLFWTFMSAGSLEWTQTDEARAYYQDGLGHQPSASLQPESEISRKRPDFSGFITNSIGDGAGTGGVDTEAQYLHYIERSIKRAWYPPKDGPENAVAFHLHRNGEISQLRIVHSGQVAIADQASLQAVEHAAPFRPLPADAKEEIEVEFYFGYGPYFSYDSDLPPRFGWARFFNY